MILQTSMNHSRTTLAVIYDDDPADDPTLNGDDRSVGQTAELLRTKQD